MTLLLKITSDGSSTLFHENLKEHYHSVHGALTESKHVFIKNGLLPKLSEKDEIRILEIGFGTGLNALLTLHAAVQYAKKIHYTAIEAFPLPEEIYLQWIKNWMLPYGLTAGSHCNRGILSALDRQNDIKILKQLHTSSWNRQNQLHKNFSLLKIQDKIQNVDFDQKFDLVYFDAFAPNKQPEMWTKDVFNKMHQAMEKNATLVTYCAKGEVKRTLKSVGFQVKTLAGPPGKREMISAIKT